MNKTYNDIVNFSREFNHYLKKDKLFKYTDILIGIAPTYIGILPCLSIFKNNIKIVGQDA